MSLALPPDISPSSNMLHHAAAVASAPKLATPIRLGLLASLFSRLQAHARRHYFVRREIPRSTATSRRMMMSRLVARSLGEERFRSFRGRVADSPLALSTDSRAGYVSLASAGSFGSHHASASDALAFDALLRLATADWHCKCRAAGLKVSRSSRYGTMERCEAWLRYHNEARTALSLTPSATTNYLRLLSRLHVDFRKSA